MRVAMVLPPSAYILRVDEPAIWQALVFSITAVFQVTDQVGNNGRVLRINYIRFRIIEKICPFYINFTSYD